MKELLASALDLAELLTTFGELRPAKLRS